MAFNCKWNLTNANYRKVVAEVRAALGDEYNYDVFRSIADTFSGNINLLTSEYVLQRYPRKNAPQEKISQAATGEVVSSSDSPIKTYAGKWTREEVAKPENQDKLFIFTDNTDRNSGSGLISDDSKYAQRYGKGKRYPKTTSAVIRGLDNAFPISTQRYYHLNATREKGRWTNADVEEFKRVVHQEIDDIIAEWNTGNYKSIVLPQGGLLTESEITDLHGKERTQILKALKEEVKRLYDAVGAPYTDELAVQEKPAEQQKQDSMIAARTEAKRAREEAAKWAREANGRDSLEVSTAGDAFGQQFSALNAVFKEGTMITIKVGKGNKAIEQTFDVGGYSIEAAYQMIKGYGRNPKGKLTDNDGKPFRKIEGKGKAPISKVLQVEMQHNTAAARQAREDFSYNTAYLPLWRVWMRQNPELRRELAKKAKGKILTDKFAKTRVSQARALAEILWGAPKTPVSQAVQDKYDIQRKNAIAASRDIAATVKKLGKQDGVKLVAKQDYNGQQVINMAQGKNDKGQQTTAKNMILSFTPSDATLSNDFELFINPFEGQKDAVKKFIQWIMPDDFHSLSDELRVEYEKSNTLRKYMAKGGWQKTEIMTDGTPENNTYANTLRYIIDNFAELRQKYNPVDIQEFGILRHKVKATVDSAAQEGGETADMLFMPLEMVSDNALVNPSEAFRLQRQLSKEGTPTGDYILVFPKDYNSKFTKAQKERLFKTIAMAVPEGSGLTISPDVADQAMLDDFNQVVSHGFTKTGDKAVTMSDGSVDYVGVFNRNGYRKPSVEFTEPYSVKELLKGDMIESGKAYFAEGAESDEFKDDDPILPIPSMHNRKYQQGSYWTDEQFPQFKAEVDKTMNKAKRLIDAGVTIVMPKHFMEGRNTALEHYAPRCYDYLMQQLEELKMYGNREAMANDYLRSRTTTVEAVDKSPSEGLDLSVEALQSPRARLRQRYNDGQIQDLARLYAKRFQEALENQFLKELKKELQTELSKTTDQKQIDKLQYKLSKLNDPVTAMITVIREIGVPRILDRIEENSKTMAQNYLSWGMIDAEQSQRVVDSFDMGFRELIFEYATPFIEDAMGIRISMSQEVTEIENQTAENDNIEDVEGEDTPEMGWSFNHRLVDPYKSLSKNVRKIISSIPMRDPNDLRRTLKDSLGEDKYWDAQYIYHSIMSRMAEMSLGEIDNFVRMTPASQLSPSEAERFPMGKPYFPVLEGMKARYSWANDLIKQLTAYYDVKSSVNNAQGTNKRAIDNDPLLMTEIGNTVSQFYTNFCQQFVPYCTMVNGQILEENKATGAASLKQTAITNYQGNLRFKGIDMIYNHDGSANDDNIEKNLDKIKQILSHIQYKGVSGESGEIWPEVKKLRNDYDSLFDAFDAASKQLRGVCKDTTDVLKACGMVFSEYDIFCVIMENKDPGIMEMLGELTAALEATEGLPANEHIFESSLDIDPSGRETGSKGKTKSNTKTPRTAWNHFFDKFGDYVTEREYESSSRILGKSRYSYTFPSYMSITLANLTNSDLEARRKYIEQNFMPYDWFYDKENKRFRNTLLQELYNGNSTFAKGHDLLAKKDGYNEKDYADWTPEDLYQLMFRELTQPNNINAGCFIIPVLSDSRVCKVIQAAKTRDHFTLGFLHSMRDVVLQELDRMKLVEKRNTIFHMQDIEEKQRLGQVLSSDERKFFNTNKELYNRYKQNHPERLQEVEHFDRNGSNFCFFPELNSYTLSLSRSQREGNTFMQNVIRILSNDMNNPSSATVSLKTVLQALQNMTEERFDNRALALGLIKTVGENYTGEDGKRHYREVSVAMSKEECIERLIEETLTSVMQEKIDNFVYDKVPTANRMGIIKQNLTDSILKNDTKLMEEYNSLRRPSENTPLTAAEEKAWQDFYNKVYNAASDFYWAHTANMAQFIQLMVTDIAYYKDPTTFGGSVDFAKRWKQVYGAGMKLNTNSKFGKKIERNIILADRVRRSHSFDVLDSVLQRAVDEGRIINVEKDAVLEKFKFIEGTNAQAYRSLTSFRDIMDMIGQHSIELARAMDNLKNNRWTMNDFYTVVNTIKPFSFGPEDQYSGVDDIRMRTMVQHKNSEAVLLAIYNTLVGSSREDDNYSAKLRGLNRAMDEIKLVDENGNVLKYQNGEEMRAIDVAQYHTAVKVGAHGVIDINYSRDALEKVQKAGGVLVGDRVMPVDANESYYSIEKRLGKLLDSGDITFEEYEKAMDTFEPTEDEVFEIIRSSIYKNGDESLGYDDQVLHKLPYSYYSIQQPTPDHYTDNDAATFGSQPRHIIMADLPDDFETTINGKKYNREQLRERYNGLIVANLIDCYVNEIEPLFDDVDKKKPAIERLRDKLLTIIDGNPKYGRSMKDALQIVKDANGNKTFALPLNNITISHQLEEILTSMFKNAIHRQKINGGNVILAADIGYSKSLKIQGKRDKDGKLISIEGIECFLPAHSRKMFEPYMEKKTKKVGDNIVEYYILDPKKLKAAGLDKAIGYRIPTEGLYSIMPLIIKGFLPQQSGSSIVVAEEVTTLTGSDNDVDKMFLMLPAFYMQKYDMKRAREVWATQQRVIKDIKDIFFNSDLLDEISEVDPKEFKEWFEEHKREFLLKSPVFRKIKTPKDNDHPIEMTKEQRDNEIIDIFYAVTTHPKMSHRWLHPGNFDNLKLNAKRLRILKDRNLRRIFMQNAGLNTYNQLLQALTFNLSQSRMNELYRRVMQIPEGESFGNKTLDDLVIDFTNRFLKPLSPVYPDTFIEMHQTYMAGVAEKGIFANNTLDHAKLQWANVEIAPMATFTFEGREVKKVDERTVQTKKGIRYISDDCAECSAAAVDNGKDPVLADLNSNKQTATFFGFLLRLGLGIEGASLLLAQPQVDWNIKTYGVVNRNKSLQWEIKKLGGWLKEHNFDTADDQFNWRTHNFTIQELYQNLVIDNYQDLFKQGTTQYAVERIGSLYRVYNLILNLKEMHSQMSDPSGILHYDSPNHAADTSIGGVIAQTKAVESVNAREELPAFDRMIVGEDQLIVYNIEAKKSSTQEKEKGFKKFESLKESARTQSPKYKLFAALMSSELPITQAFYTLGIEKVRTQFGSQFAYGRPEMQNLTDRLWDFMNRRYIGSMEEKAKIVSQMYTDWVVYNLSKTNLFGDDELTFDQKRQYYLYEYPARFLQLKATMPELNSIDAIRRMSVRKGMIIMDRGGKTTITLRDFITDSFDTLIQHENPEVQQVAKDLFLYTYYLNGFEFSYMSFGNMMGTEFQRAFPEYIQALQDMNKDVITDEDLDNFFDQFQVKRNSLGLLREITYADSKKKSEALQSGKHDTGITPEEYGGMENVDEYVRSVSIVGGKVKAEVLKLNKPLTEIYGTIIYEPLRLNTSFHYNANQTMDEMTEVVYDQEKIDANRRIGSKKRSKASVSYDTYMANKSRTEVSSERDANTPEPKEAGDVSRAALEEPTDTMSDDAMEKAVGSTIGKDEETVVDEYDAYVQNNIKARNNINEDDTKEDADIQEAQDIIASNNDGRGLCIQ